MSERNELSPAEQAIVEKIARKVINETREFADLRAREIAHAVVTERVKKSIDEHVSGCPFGKSIAQYRAYVIGWAAGGGAVGGTMTGIILMVANWIF